MLFEAPPYEMDSTEVINIKHENNKLSHVLTLRKALHKWTRKQYEAGSQKQVNRLTATYQMDVKINLPVCL